MFRVLILIPLMLIFSPTASAQFGWLKIKRPPAPRYAELQPARCLALHQDAVSALSHLVIIADVDFGMSEYCFELTEAASLKALYHSLRFHQDAQSLKNYHTLIDHYLSQGHYSEAKWHLLQCNMLAQKMGDTDGLIYSMTQVAVVKTELGEFDQAHDDLMQVRAMCTLLGRAADVADIDKKLGILKVKQLSNAKSESKYAAVVEEEKSGK